MIIPPNTCRGLCCANCKNACQFNKFIWAKDYREPRKELYLELDVSKLSNKDLHYIRRNSSNIYNEIYDKFKQYRYEKNLEALLELEKIKKSNKKI